MGDEPESMMKAEPEKYVPKPPVGNFHKIREVIIPAVEEFDWTKHGWVYSLKKYDYAPLVGGMIKSLVEFRKEKEIEGFVCVKCNQHKLECSEQAIDVCVDCYNKEVKRKFEEIKSNELAKSKKMDSIDLDNEKRDVRIGQTSESEKKGLNFKVYITDAVKGMNTFLDDDSVNLFLIDPPYNVTNKKTDGENPEEVGRNYKNLQAPKGDWDYFETEEDFQKFTDDWISQCYRKSKSNGSILIHATTHNLFASKLALEKAGYELRQILIWHVINASPSLTNKLFKAVYEFILWGTKSGGYTFNNTKQPYVEASRQIENLIPIPFLQGKERVKGHPTQKPSELLRILIRTLSNEADLVCDCFLGSGSTMLSCKMENRNCIGFEKREECVGMIKQKVAWDIQPPASKYKMNYELKIGGEKEMESGKSELLQDLNDVKNIERNKIYQGDCIKGLSMMADKCVDCIITDPPYGMNYKSNFSKNQTFDKIENDDNLDFFEPFVKEAHRVMKDDTCMYLFCRFDCYPLFYEVLSKYFNIKNCLIWKKHGSAGGLGDLESSYMNTFELIIFAHKGRRVLWKGGYGRQGGLIEDSSLNGNDNLLHPTQKPIEILRQFVSDATNEGDLIVDAFSGSGSTLIASIREKRDFIGFELSANYCATIKARIEDESEHLSSFFGVENKKIEPNEKLPIARNKSAGQVQNQMPLGFAGTGKVIQTKSDIPEEKINAVIDKYSGMISRDEAILRIKQGDD